MKSKTQTITLVQMNRQIQIMFVKKKSLENGNNNIQGTGRVQYRKTGHKRQIINESQPSDKDAQIVEDQNNLPNERIFNKKHKIKHNKKCSGCLKKYLNKDVVECGSCPKSFHRTCLPTNFFQKTQPFLCQNCQEVMKEKKLEKTHKVTTSSRKLTRLQKMIKPNDVIESEIPIVKDRSPSLSKKRSQFYRKYSIYIRDGKIQFPVQDTLFDEFPPLLKKDTNFVRPSPTQKFTPSFGTVLEAWNIIQTFDKDFPEHSYFTMWQLYKLLQSKDNFIIIQRLYIKLVEYLLRDIFAEKFQTNEVVIKNPFLFLMKYCKEIGMLDKIYKYVWIQFLNQISKLPDFKIMFNSSKFKRLIKKSRVGQKMQPWKLEDKIFVLQIILNEIAESKSYHDDLQSKIERIQQNTKLKQQTLKNIKKIESKIRQLADLKRENKNLLNTLNNQQHQGNEQKISKEIQKIKKKQKQILDEEKDLKKKLKKEKIVEKKLPPDENKAYANVEFLGKDKQNRNYWYVPQYRDKIFVNCVSNDWFGYDSLNIDQLIKSLNSKGIREKQLLEKLQEYNKNNCFRQLDKTNKSKDSQQILLQKIKKHKANYRVSRGTYFERQKFISFDFIKRILLLGKKKMTVYLKQKGYQWCPLNDKMIFIDHVKKIKTNKELIQAARQLNERVCVVQKESNIPDQKEGQQIPQIGKLRKFQTKIWGLNQKYKNAWLKYLESCQENLPIKVFFLNYILFLTIDKYVNKIKGDSNTGKKKINKNVPLARSNQIQNVKKNIKMKKQKPKKTNVESKFEWNQTCGVCEQFGELLCCDLCPKVFHLNCIGLTKVPESSYLCNECETKRHTRLTTKKIRQNTGK